MGTGKERVAVGTEFFIAVDVFPMDYPPTKFQWSALQIGQGSSIYILEIKQAISEFSYASVSKRV